MVTRLHCGRSFVFQYGWRWAATFCIAVILAGLSPSPAQAGITLVQHTSKDAGIVASSSLAFPANNSAGNWIGVVIRAGHTGQVFTISDTRGNTYKQAVQFNETLDGANGESLAIYYAENISAGANTVTVSESLTNNTLRFAILEYSGVATSSSLDVTAAAQGSGTTLNSGTATTTVGGDLILGEVTSADAVTFTAGSGYTIEERVPAAPNTKLIAEDAIQLAAGAASVGATMSISNNGGALLAAFKAASVTPPPSISSLTPNNGPVGTSVTIAGANFGASQGSSTVTFNGVSAGTASSWTASSITVNVPSGATTGSVIVTVGGVQSNGVAFTVTVPPPSISTLTPSNGPVGTSVTIAGASFGASQGSSTVTFNGVSAGTASSWTASSITVNVPSGATTGSVIVTVGGVQSNSVAFTVTVPPPSISTLTPNNGPVGTSVTIAGANFGGSQGSSTVTFNGVSAGTASSWTASSITVNVPSGATTGNVIVTVGGVQSNSLTFTVAPPPSISSLTPNSGTVGTPTTIAGSNLGGSQGSNTVTFNGVSAGTAASWGASSITVNVPSGATTGNVIVTVGGVQSNSLTFTVTTPPPSISTLTPNNGPVGSSVTIAGANFGGSQGSNTVTFNGVSAGTAASWGASSITVSVPSGATTGNVIVTVGGVQSNSLTFTVTTPPPSITSLTPNNGVVGTQVTIAGSNLGGSQGSSTVTFNGVSAGTASSWTATSIAVNVPSGATTGNVVVTVGGQASNGLNFTVTSAPATIKLVQQASKDAGIVSSASLAFPANNTAGNWIGVLIRAGHAGQVFTVNDSRGNTYKQAIQFNQTLDTPNGESLAIYYAENIGAGANTVTVANSIANNTLRYAIVEYSGVAISNSFDIAAATQSAGSPFNSGNVTTTANGDLLLGLVAAANSGTFTAGTGFTLEAQIPAAPNTKLVAEDMVQSVAGTASVSAALSPSTDGAALLAAFKAAAGGGPAGPSISSLTPNSGPVGTSVTIAGSNFGGSQGTSTVTFNGVSAGAATSWSASSITVNVPTGATSGNVVVTVGGVQSNTLSFTVTSTAPSLSTLTPNNGPVGTSVTIAGSNFGASQGSSTVTFNGVSAGTASNWTASSITVNVPAGATSGNVVVTVGGVQSNTLSFTVTSTAPSISSLAPNNGPVGTSVTIAGSNLGGSQSTSTVTFNGVSAGTATSWSASSITVNVPTGATSGNVVVTVGGVQSNTLNFTVTSTAPSISSLTPNNGPVGTSVTIAGTNFGGSQGTSAVAFNGVSAGTATSWSASSITVNVPTGATSGNVIVTVGGVPSNTLNFTVTVPSSSGIALVQHTSIDAGITASASLAFASANKVGDFIAVVIRGGKVSQTFTLSDTRGNTYKQAVQVNLTVDGETMAIYYAESIAAGSNTVTVSESISNNTLRFAILEYSGVAPSGSLDATAYGQSADTEPSTGNAATTAVGDLLIAEMTNGDGTNYTAGAGFTAEEAQPASPNSKFFVEDGIQPLPGLVAGTSSMGGVHNWGAVMAAFKAATGAAGPHIVNLSPGTAPASALVTIAGTNFGSSQGTSTVTFNGTAATPRSWSSTSIVVTVPASATSGNVVVTVGGTASNGVNFTVGPAPPIAFVQVNSSLTIEQGLIAQLSFVTVPFKGAQTTGNLNVVFVGWHDSTATISSVSDSAGNVYTLAAAPVVFSGAATQAIYYAKDILASPPNSNTVSVTFSRAATQPDVLIAEYAGLDPVNPLDVTAGAQGSGGTSNSGSATTANANDLLVGANVVSTASSAAGTGFTSRVISQNGGILEDRIVSATGSYNATATLSPSGNWIMQMAAFKAPTAAAAAISVVVSPGSANTATGYGTQNFSATLQNDVQRLGVTWALSGTGCSGSSCGTLSNATSTSVTYTGPANLPSPAGVTITATSVADPTKSGSAAITVTQGTLNVAIFPKRAAVTLSQVQQFNATVTNDSANAGVVWSVDGNNGGNSTSGTISAAGLFTPGTQAGVHTVTATSVSNASVNISASVAVTDFAGSFSFHYDQQSTGQNTHEYALTTSTVNSSTFGLLFSCPVDGFMFATPLYVPNLAIGGQTHNVIFIATEHNSVYAFDADSSSCAPLWKTNFLGSGVLTVSPSDTGDGVSLVTEFGITSTPAIDPVSNTIYVVANTKETVGSGCSPTSPCFFYRLHALDLTTGAEKFGGPVVITAPNFVPLFELQRPGLLLNGGNVYVGFGSHADLNTWQGWLMAYNASTLAQVFAWSSTVPTGGNNEGAIWGAGNPPVADASGNVYVVTGNGTFDGTSNYADSVVKLTSSGSVADFFTPFDQSSLAASDIDLGSSGAIILPDAVGSSTHQHLVLATGKIGVLYLLDQTNMGKFHTGANTDVQEVNVGFNITQPDQGFFGQPAYWNGNIYTVMTADSLRQFPISNGVVTNPASSVASKVYTYRGATPSVSSSGITNGIVWVEDITDYQSNGPTQLDAYDASHVATMLYTSPVSGSGVACSASKFTTPVVANGKVYIGGSNCFSVFGLLPY